MKPEDNAALAEQLNEVYPVTVVFAVIGITTVVVLTAASILMAVGIL